MAKTIEIRPLAKDDDRSGFSCGQPDLDRFFEHYAGQNQFKLHLAVTYVALVESRILAFATVAASSVERASVPSALLRKRLPAYPSFSASRYATTFCWSRVMKPAMLTSKNWSGRPGTRAAYAIPSTTR